MVSTYPASLTRPPTTDRDWQQAEAVSRASRPQWLADLIGGRRELAAHLSRRSRLLVGDDRGSVISGDRSLDEGEVVLLARLKTPRAILRKMQRFGESMSEMLDIWGYRIVVPHASDLDETLECVLGVWEEPSVSELTLRGGALQFDPVRDYRKRSHAGLGPATSMHYDDAIHINRHAPFGVCEIQLLSYDLFYRSVVAHGREESHLNFSLRRNRLHARMTQNEPPAQASR
jgi:hypothetical protein